MSTETTTQTIGVWPALRYRDARAAIDFLTHAFGFQAVAVYEDGDLVVHAELRWPRGGGVMLGSARDDAASRDGFTPRLGVIYAVTGDADALHDHAAAAGAEIVVALHDTDYGSRDFTARDPEGVRWSFGTYAGHEPPAPDGDPATLERDGWEALSTDGQAARAFYDRTLDDACTMLLPGGLTLDDRAAILDAMSGAPWSRYELEDIACDRPTPDTAVVRYGVVAERDRDAYSARIASLYVRRGDAWRLAFHQQTPR